MVVFHQDIRARFRQQLRTGHTAQSCVFAGPRGIGKLTLALWYAKFLTCAHKGTTRPCDACSACRAIQGAMHADITVEAGDRTAPIGVEEIRILRERLTRTPLISSLSICIIPDCERISLAAQHALLKTLEEPRPHSVLIMTADAPVFLLPTVLSRMTVIRLNPVPASLVTRALREADPMLAADEIKGLIAAARGIPGRIMAGSQIRADARARTALVRSMTAGPLRPLWRMQKELRESFDKDETYHDIAEMVIDMPALPRAATPLLMPLLASLSRNVNKDLAIDTLGMILASH